MKLDKVPAQVWTVAAIGVGVALIYWLVKDDVRDLATAGKKIFTEGLNPLSQNNVAYRSVNAVGAKLTDDEHFTLGGWLYDKIHGEYRP